MEEKYILDMLTCDGVSVKKQTYIEHNGQLYPIGQPWRRAYANSATGRQAVIDELPEPQQTAILAVWGDSPTIIEDLSV
jgi:hypothetical protein